MSELELRGSRRRQPKAGPSSSGPPAYQGAIAGVIWRVVGTPEEVRLSRRRLVETLLGLPQPPADGEAPNAWLPRGEAQPGEGLSQSPAPLGYREVRQRLGMSGWAERGDFRDVLAEELEKALGAKRKLARPRGADTWSEKPMSRPRQSLEPAKKPRKPAIYYDRPGEGGWHPREGKVSPREAAAELLPLFGPYSELRGPDGSRVYVWDARATGVKGLDPHGDTILHARKSTEETQGGETTRFGQIEPGLDLAERAGLKVRMVVVAECMSGTWEPEFRLDFQLARQAMLQGGWAENVIWLNGERIARDVGPGEWLYRLVIEQKVKLWLTAWGRYVRWHTADKFQLRIENTVAANNRDEQTRKMHTQRYLQGPLAGRGYPEKPPFGFRWDKAKRRHVEDPVQMRWVHRIFELAEAAVAGEGASTYQIAEQVRKEGCGFDHDRIRTILGDPIYVTGEYVVHVADLPVLQEPLELSKPVSAVVFQEIQDILRLRRARTERTPLGEFILNYVRFAHARCDGQVQEKTGKDGKVKRHRPLIKGYYLHQGNDKVTARYRHSPYCPEDCRFKGYTWDKQELEQPVISVLRRALKDPELLLALQQAALYEPAAFEPGLDQDEEGELEATLAQLEVRLADAERDFTQALVTRAGEDSASLYMEILQPLKREMARLERRLEESRAAKARETPGSLRALRREQRLDAALEILTYETPDDPHLKRIRARLVQEMISEVILHEDGKGRQWLEIRGHLRPEGLPSLEATDPLHAAGGILDAYLIRQAEETGEVPAWLAQDVQLASVIIDDATATWLQGNEPGTASASGAEDDNLVINHQVARGSGAELRAWAASGDGRSAEIVRQARENSKEYGITGRNNGADGDSRTDLDRSAAKSVRELAEAAIAAPSQRVRLAAERASLDSTAWHRRNHARARKREGDRPSWMCEVSIDPADLSQPVALSRPAPAQDALTEAPAKRKRKRRRGAPDALRRPSHERVEHHQRPMGRPHQ